MKHLLLLHILVIFSIYNNIFCQNLVIIPDTLSGSLINLTLATGIREFYSGSLTKTLGYNGSYLGKTLILYKGQKVKLNVFNGLQEPTSTHWHGLHVAPHNDGSPHTVIDPGTSWTPEFTVMDKAGTYWYHPHLHGRTLKQVVKGAAGMIIVRDEEEANLGLPRTYGLDDIPLIFQFQTFDFDKQIVESDAVDNAILVNGTLNGEIVCPAQMVRLRLLNASSHRIFRFGFENNMPFSQIASDAGLLNVPVQMTRLNLGSGERAEIILDLSAHLGKSIKLKTFGNELNVGYPGGPNLMGMQAGPLDNKTNDILTIVVREKLANAITTIPQQLTTNEILSQTNSSNRSINFTAQPMMSMDNFYINNAKFDAGVINFKTKLNNTEIWTISNQTMMAHPFHIHGNHFYILSINGQPPPENMKGRKDVVLVPPFNGIVKLITMFKDFSDDMIPYMYHCHILSHEDNGMMGQFLVTDVLSRTNEDKINQKIGFEIRPNPASEIIYLTSKIETVANGHIVVFNSQGKIVYDKPHTLLPAKIIKIDINNWEIGSYIVSFNFQNLKESIVFIKK